MAKTKEDNQILLNIGRIKLYHDFAINLLYTIDAYYLDYETLKDDMDIKNHYNWCYDKVCSGFLDEEIDFRENKKLKNYYFDYYYHEFYSKKTKQSLDKYKKFIDKIFDINKLRESKMLDVLIDIYTISDKSIKSLVFEEHK